MSKKLTFKDFKNSVDNRSFPVDRLGDYLAIDPDSAVLKLKFKEDALLDTPSGSYDVDYEIYKMNRDINEAESVSKHTFKYVGKETVVAEGDSWFNMPPFFWPVSIADRIDRNGKYDINNIAYWGHTLSTILAEKEYMEKINEERTEFFILSAGGNDLQDQLSKGGLIADFEDGMPVSYL